MTSTVMIAGVLVAVGLTGTTRADPPGSKARQALRLGHFANRARGIGLVIDLTQTDPNPTVIAPAKLRFDGEQAVVKLAGAHGQFDRLDYRASTVMLEVWPDGSRAVQLRDPDSDHWGEPIELVRTGDANPL